MLKRSCLVALTLTLAISAAPKARIKIDTERVNGQVAPHLFGNFAEHLGRCIYGGIFEEGSPLSDADGYRKDVMEATRNLGVTLLRWPGGNFVSGYNWKDGIGPRELRPVRPEGAWGSTESNRFGTNEFLNYCERIKVEPYICINAGLGTISEARDWVEYTNEARATPIGRSNAAKTAVTSHGMSKFGALAMNSTAPGSSATRTPRITRNSPLRPPRPCGAWTVPSN